MDKAASMVRTLGYQPVLTIDKRRSIYFLGPSTSRWIT